MSLRVTRRLAAAIALVALSITHASNSFAENPQPRKIYSGWIPYYSMKTSLPAALNNADLIREVMPFWYTFKYNGTKASITDLYTPANPSVPIATPLASMKAAGFTIIPTITDGTDKLVLANLLSTEAGRTAAVKVINDLVMQNNFDGIDLDFEGFAFVDGNTSWPKTKPFWVAFVKQLSATLHANGKLLSITTPYLLDPASGKKGYYVYAWAEIAPVIDRLRIMTYDYSVANPGPIGPLSWTENTVKYAVSIMPASKVFVGLAGYGRDWVTKVEGVCPADVSKTVVAGAKAATFIMSNAANLAAGYGATINYNEVHQEATFTYQKTYNGNTSTGLATSCVATRVAWYQDARAYQARAQLVAKYRLGGLVAWTIGFEDPQAMTNIRNVALSIAPDKVLSTISSDLSEFTYGQPINLAGVFTLQDKQPIAGLPVKVEVKNSSDLNWREITTLITGVDGKVALPLYLGVNQSVRLRSDGTWERTEGISNEQIIKVKPQLKINAPTSAALNGKIAISGVVNPGKQVLVSLEKYDGKWTQVATTSTDTNGGFSFSYSANEAPFMKFRVAAAGSQSAAVTVVIR
jgi:spore germination protein YaaH/5-hydroxyisourate hydrolase-like protein (transthyretin family)